MIESLINPGDAWKIWSLIAATVALSIWLEQRYAWAAKVSGPVLAILGAILLANLRILPTASPSYDLIWAYIVPLSLPLLLMRANLFHIIRTTGTMFGAFHISALGTLLGAFLAVLLLGSVVPFAAELSGIMTGSYIGGGVNFFALVGTFTPPEELSSALIVADNIIMALAFLLLVALPGISFFRERFRLEDQLEAEKSADGNPMHAASFWKAKEIGLRDIALAFGIAFFIVAVATSLSGWLGTVLPQGLARDVLGNQFLLITTIAVVIATLFHRSLEKVRGSDELGTYLIYLFFFALGVPADLWEIIQKAPVLFLFCAVMAVTNILVTLLLGRLFNIKLEELAIVISAALGGPMTAVALAIAKGWRALVLPALLVGIWGYVIGTYLGVLVGNLLQTWL